MMCYKYQPLYWASLLLRIARIDFIGVDDIDATQNQQKDKYRETNIVCPFQKRNIYDRPLQLDYERI